jgi:hypothetical protein
MRSVHLRDYNRGVEDVLERPPAQKTTPHGHRLRLVEETSGAGVLERRGAPVGAVTYAIARYLGVVEGSGLPIPGLHSIDGRIAAQPGTDLTGLVGAYLTLTLADGRAFGVSLLDADGRIGTEARHPVGCGCC